MPWRVKDYADGWIVYPTEVEARASEEAKNGATIMWDGCPFCFVTDPAVMRECVRCIEREGVQAQIAALAARVAKLEDRERQLRTASVNHEPPRREVPPPGQQRALEEQRASGRHEAL